MLTYIIQLSNITSVTGGHGCLYVTDSLLKIKPLTSNLVPSTPFWNNLNQVCGKSKDWRANIFFNLGELEHQLVKHHSQNGPRSPMHEGGEP